MTVLLRKKQLKLILPNQIFPTIIISIISILSPLRHREAEKLKPVDHRVKYSSAGSKKSLHPNPNEDYGLPPPKPHSSH